MNPEWIPTLVWLVPVFPLVGFLLIAFLGRGMTGAPLPVVETGGDEHHGHAEEEEAHAQGVTDAAAQNSGPSDAPAFVADPAVAGGGHDAGTDAAKVHAE